MPAVQSEHIFFIASMIEVLTQLLKGPVPEKYRVWIPVALFVVGVGAGLGFGAYYGGDLIAGGLEGFFGAASALGFYQVAKRLPVVETAFGARGWLGDS